MIIFKNFGFSEVVLSLAAPFAVAVACHTLAQAQFDLLKMLRNYF